MTNLTHFEVGSVVWYKHDDRWEEARVRTAPFLTAEYGYLLHISIRDGAVALNECTAVHPYLLTQAVKVVEASRALLTVAGDLIGTMRGEGSISGQGLVNAHDGLADALSKFDALKGQRP